MCALQLSDLGVLVFAEFGVRSGARLQFGLEPLVARPKQADFLLEVGLAELDASGSIFQDLVLLL